MTDVRGFRGLRYTSTDLSGVLAPPYDVVSLGTQQSMIGANPNNVLAVDNPALGLDAESARQQAYTNAGHTLNSWLSHGILAPDDSPSMYVVVHEFASRTGPALMSRIGIIALLPAIPWAEADVRPHEKTFAGPKLDRMHLMRATRTQTSPIFVMWQDAEEIDQLLAHTMLRPFDAQGELAGEFGSERLKLWRVSANHELATFTQAFVDHDLYIADGHHRYETAVAFAQESGGDHPSVLAYMSSADDPGMCVLSTHRVIALPKGIEKPNASTMRATLGRGWTVQSLPESGDDGTPLRPADDKRKASNHNFAVLTTNEKLLLSRPPSAGASPRDSLDVSVLHDELLPALGVDGASIITFERDADAVAMAVANGRADLGILMAPPSVADVIRVADANQTMPQKSTYFYPKVPTGLVMFRVSDSE
jgi:uncharacterized protein (DUF1015 family)